MTSRLNLLLLTLGVDETGKLLNEFKGITRLQKLIFLYEREEMPKSQREVYTFRPYKAGPFSKELYADIEFLENLGLVESVDVSTALPEEFIEDEFFAEETDEFDGITFETLMGGVQNSSPRNYDGRCFRLTEKGRAEVQRLLGDPTIDICMDGIKKIKSKYSYLSLTDLLYYVYTKYPESATESEIKEQVLTKRGKKWQR